MEGAVVMVLALGTWLLRGQAADLHPGMVCIFPVVFVLGRKISQLRQLPVVVVGEENPLNM